MKKIVLLLLLLTTFSYSQETKYPYISEYYRLFTKNKDSAIVLCNKLINSSSYEKKVFGIAGKGHVYASKADYEKAQKLFDKSTSVLEDGNVRVDREIKVNILYLKALSYTLKQDVDRALTLLSSALDNCNGKCSFLLENKIRSTQGRIYSMTKNTFKALEIVRIGLKRIREQPDFSTSYELKKEYLRHLAKISSRSMNTYLIDKEKHKNYLDSAKTYPLIAKKFAIENNIHIYDHYIMTYFADIEFYQKKFKSAKEYYKNALEIDFQKKNKKRIAQMEFQIARCDFEMGNLNDAEATFKRQVKENVWSQYQILENEALCYDYLAKIYKQKGDSKKAIEYGDTYIKIYAKFLAKKSSYDLNVNNKMHFEERKREVEALKKENEHQKQQKQLYSYISIVLVIAFLGLMIFFIYKNKKTRQNINKLNERLEWLQQNVSKKTNISKSSSLSDENALQLIEKLKALEKKELFNDLNYSLNMVAKKLDTNSSYLSKTVNDYMNISFVEYSNRLKINSIIQRLNHQKSLRNYTIEALAKEAGYKSVNAFNTNFKKLLKVTPSQYIGELKKC